MQFNNLRTLVLNANFMPIEIFPDLGTISPKVAITSYLDDKCEVVHFYERPVLINGEQRVHPEKGPLFWPSVIMYKNGFSKKKVMRLTHENLYLRDHFACVYCGTPIALSDVTMDHLVPKSQGGKRVWTNIVAACHPCNQKKADSQDHRKWVPNRKPYVPDFYDLLAIRKKKPLIVDDENWLMFLPQWESEVIVRKDHKPLEGQNVTTSEKLEKMIANNDNKSKRKAV